MPTYRFRCRTPCEGFDAAYSMVTVPDVADCPRCGGAARRIISAPSIGRGASTAMRLHDATAATADRPNVVSAVPSTGRTRRPTPVSRNPLHARLPRP